MMEWRKLNFIPIFLVTLSINNPAQAAVAPGPGVAGAGPGHRQPLQQRLQPGVGRQGRDRGHQGGFILLLFVTY